MNLSILWQPLPQAAQSKIDVPVFGAELSLTLLGDIIVDASWQLADSDTRTKGLCELAQRVQGYLLAPHRQSLEVKLWHQGSDYYRRVWQALLEIPLGETLSYSALAEILDSGPRAIARACSGNPYAGLIPCHRVVAKSGIGGFMGDSSGDMVALKQRILDSERQIAEGRT